jgi:hypothetical protein
MAAPILSEKYRAIPLTKGKFAIVDAEEYEALAKFKWYAKWDRTGKRFYAARNSKYVKGEPRTTVRMHRQIMKPAPGMEIDHKDGDGLRNTHENMREVTHSENQQNRGLTKSNTSGRKGASFHKLVGKWQARIRTNGKERHIGYFDSIEEAHAAYVAAAKEEQGEFANW